MEKVRRVEDKDETAIVKKKNDFYKLKRIVKEELL